MKIFLYTWLISGLASAIISCGGSDDSASSSGATETTATSSDNITTGDNTTSSSESLSGSGVFIVAGLSGNILRSTNKGVSFDKLIENIIGED